MKIEKILDAISKGNENIGAKACSEIYYLIKCRLFVIENNNEQKEELNKWIKFKEIIEQNLEKILVDKNIYEDIISSIDEIFNLNFAQIAIAYYEDTHDTENEKPDTDKIFKNYQEAPLGDVIGFKYGRILQLFETLHEGIGGNVDNADGYKKEMDYIPKKGNKVPIKKAEKMLKFGKEYKRSTITELENQFKTLCTYSASLEHDLIYLDTNNSRSKKLKDLFLQWLEIRNDLLLQRLIAINHITWYVEYDIRMAQLIIDHKGKTDFEINKEEVEAMEKSFLDLQNSVAEGSKCQDHLNSIEIHIQDFLSGKSNNNMPNSQMGLDPLEQKIWYRLIKVFGKLIFGVIFLISIALWWNNGFDSNSFSYVLWTNLITYFVLIGLKKTIIYVAVGE